MKNFVVTLAIFLSVLLLWAIIGMKRSDRSFLLPSTVLDRATPLNVNIDVDFIKSLKDPAYGK
ncbi:hypothetical protein K0B04_03430 [Patescibacteria group bacterium]|nr:hypothetical protein [Patescibacteria group bacterium]